MNKKLLSCGIAFSVLTGCASIGGAIAEKVTLPNGSQGLTVDCTAYGWSACFKAAGEACKSGYAIHERSMEENMKTEVPTEPLEDVSKKLIAEMPTGHLREKKDKYMVISCK